MVCCACAGRCAHEITTENLHVYCARHVASLPQAQQTFKPPYATTTPMIGVAVTARGDQFWRFGDPPCQLST